MEIHYKTTMWVSARFAEDAPKEEILRRLQEGENYNDLLDEFGIDEYQDLYDTQETMTPDENRGQATVELMYSPPEGGGLIAIWDNKDTTNILTTLL